MCCGAWCAREPQGGLRGGHEHHAVSPEMSDMPASTPTPALYATPAVPRGRRQFDKKVKARISVEIG